MLEGQKIAELMRIHIIAENGLISQHSVRLVNYSSVGGMAREKEKDWKGGPDRIFFILSEFCR